MGHEQHNFSSNMMGAETGNSKLNIKVNGVDHEYQPSGGDQEVAITEAVVFELSDSPTYAEVSEVVATHIPCYLHVSGSGVDYMVPYAGNATNSFRFEITDAPNQKLLGWLIRNGASPITYTSSYDITDTSKVIAAALNDLNARLSALESDDDNIGDVVADSLDAQKLYVGGVPVKRRQPSKSWEGSATKTVTSLLQDEDGELTAAIEDIEFPENVKMLFQPSYLIAKNDYDSNKTDFLKADGIVYMLNFVDNEKAVYISRDGTDLKTLTIDTNNFAETKTFKPAINLGWLGVAGRPSSGKYVKVCEIETPWSFNMTYSTRFHIDVKPIGSSDGENAIFFVSIGDHQDSDTHVWYPDINAGWEYVSKQSTERIAQAVVTTDTTTGKIEVWLELTSGTNAQVFVTALENNSNATGIPDNELAYPRFKYACEYVQPSDSSWETSGTDVYSYPVASIQQTLTVLRANLTPALIDTVQYAVSRDMNIVFVDTDDTRFVISKTIVNGTSCKLNGISKTTNRLDISFVEVTYTFATQTWSVTRDDSVIREAIQDESYVLDWDDIPSMPPAIYSRIVARMADTYNTNRGILRLRKDGLELFCSGTTNVGTVTTFKFDGSKVDTSGPYGIATHAEIVYDSGANTFTRSSTDYQWNLTAI